MTNSDSPAPARFRPLAVAAAGLVMGLGLLAVVIQSVRLGTGVITYEGSVVSFIGGFMFATIGAMALAMALRRR